MESSSLIRLLCLLVAVLFGGWVGTATGWISSTIEPGFGRTLVAGGTGFAGAFLLILTAIRFLSGRDS
ncbi:hypothetical protein [Micromonospora sp. NPDC000442]|uniref:hypothetical protein n=1 Tax=Micromonospora sp. NPDC000442 TaxID=3364217 RepID=UPI0036793AC8